MGNLEKAIKALNTIKIGSIVEIRKSSRFFGQNKNRGTITEVRDNLEWCYEVTFEDGMHNCYKKEDLKLA